MATQKVLIKRGTKAALDNLMQTQNKLLSGELAFTVDTKEVYISDGTTAHLVGRVITGPLSSRPGAGVVGRMFVVTEGTDVGKAFVDDGTQWVEVTPLDAVRSDLTDHINNTSIHFVIDDSTTATNKVWSSQKIQSAIDSAIIGLSWREPVIAILSTPDELALSVGDRYLIDATAFGEFSGHENSIATQTGTAWTFETPSANQAVFVKDVDSGYTFDAETNRWLQFSTAISQYVGGDGIAINGNVISAVVDQTTIKISSDKIIIGDVAGAGLSGGNGSKLDLAFTSDPHPFAFDAENKLKLKVDGQSIDFDQDNNNVLYVKVIDCGEF